MKPIPYIFKTSTEAHRGLDVGDEFHLHFFIYKLEDKGKGEKYIKRKLQKFLGNLKCNF